MPSTNADPTLEAGDVASSPAAVQPLRPRPHLFLVLLGVFVVWIAALAVLKFSTT